jgi:MoaA/NifB/PqqE/SkfB family radical SAM enzyme
VPWRSIFVSPDSRVSPCCAYQQGTYGESDATRLIDHPRLEEIRSQFRAGEVPKGCVDCFRREAMGLKSWRIEASEVYEKWPREETKEFLLRHLDISFGNTCNLKCRFCRAENSTAWIADKNALIKDRSRFGVKWAPVGAHDNSALLESIFEMDLSKLMLVEIKGGEPFLYPKHEEFLDRLLAKVDRRRLKIHYVTNGSVYQAGVIERLKTLGRVSITLSVDGTGANYQYVRGGKLRLEKEIEANLRKWDEALSHNLFLTFYFTLCAYNVFEMTRLSDWVHSLNLKSRFRIQIVPLTDPDYLRVGALPFEVREEVAASLPRTPEFAEAHTVLLERNGDQPLLFHDFCTYTYDLDKVRGQKIRDFIPELGSRIGGFETTLTSLDFP